MPQRGRRNADPVLIMALACGATVEAAAHKVGVSPATVYRRQHEPEFQRLLREARSGMVERTAAALTALGLEAARALAELLKSSTPAAVRLGAVRIALESGLKIREVADLEQRLTTLEQLLGNTVALTTLGHNAPRRVRCSWSLPRATNMVASIASLRTKLKRLEALADQRRAARRPLEDQAAPEKRLCENSLYEFVQRAWPHIEPAPFLDNWHIGALCEHLQAVTSGQIMKLLVNIPPGMSKSLLVSVFWPMWEWTTHPEIRWFYASYDQRLSTRDSVRCRALLESRWYQNFWPLRLKGDQNQKTYYETEQGGYRLATSIGGHGTGEHPHRIVVDDPNSVQQAESEAARLEVQQWWTLTMPTRGVTLNARRVCIQQRTHQEDFSGMAFREGGWTAIVLPMRYEKQRMEPTPLGWNDPRAEEGELLAPKQFSEEKVQAMEQTLRLLHGNYGVAGQLQQRPTPREGGMFKRPWFEKTLSAAPCQGPRVRYWDKAATASGGDWTVGILMGKTPQGVFFVEDMVRGQWSAHERNVTMKQTAQKDAAQYGGLVTIWIEQEGTAGGKESAEWSVKDLAGYPVRVEPAVSAKDIRAEPLAAQAEAGNVVLIAGPWNGTFLDELCAFPNGKNDDIVDAASGAFNKLALGRSLFSDADRAASISSKIPLFVPQARASKQ